MKKLFVAVLAVAALASCAQEDVILDNDKAITFGDAYVANSTKAIYDDSNKVEAFKVWGTVTPNGATASVVLYDGAKVEDKNDVGYDQAWQCEVERFWTPNCNYAFYAVVDAAEGEVIAKDADNNPTGVPTSITYSADGVTDLLYGATTKTTGDTVSNPGLVAFTMQHLLSKVSFKFTNTNTNADYDYKVTKVEVLGAYTNGTYTITHGADKINGNYDGVWAGTGKSDTALSFLDGELTLTDATINADKTVTASTAVAPKSFVIIPGIPALDIAITVETLLNNTKIYSKDYTLTVNQDGGTAKEFVKNTHYNLVVALEGGKPIQFTIDTVDGFPTPGSDVTIQ